MFSLPIPQIDDRLRIALLEALRTVFAADRRHVEAFVEGDGALALDHLHASHNPQVVQLVDELQARFLANEEIEIFGGAETTDQNHFSFPQGPFQPPGGFNFQ